MTFYALISHSWDSVMKDISSNDQKAAHSVPSARRTCAFSWEEGKRWQSRNYGMMPPVKGSEGHHDKQSTWGTEIRAMASGALLLQISPSPKVWRLLLQFPANRLFLRGVIKYSFWVKDIAKATECNSKSTQKNTNWFSEIIMKQKREAKIKQFFSIYGRCFVCLMVSSISRSGSTGKK